MKKYLKEQAEIHIPTLMLGALGFLALKIWSLLIRPMLPVAYKMIDTKSAIMLFLLSGTLNLAFLALIIRSLLKEKEIKLPEPTIHHGVYWDYLFKPLCPSCKAPLRTEEKDLLKILPTVNKDDLIPKLLCPNGHFNNYLTNNLGFKLHPSKARSELMDLYCEVVKI